MKVAAQVSCPRCGSDLTAGPSEEYMGRVSRRAVACGCGWMGVVTLTLVERRARSVDHVAVA